MQNWISNGASPARQARPIKSTMLLYIFVSDIHVALRCVGDGVNIFVIKGVETLPRTYVCDHSKFLIKTMRLTYAQFQSLYSSARLTFGFGKPSPRQRPRSILLINYDHTDRHVTPELKIGTQIAYAGTGSSSMQVRRIDSVSGIPPSTKVQARALKPSPEERR